MPHGFAVPGNEPVSGMFEASAVNRLILEETAHVTFASRICSSFPIACREPKDYWPVAKKACNDCFLSWRVNKQAAQEINPKP